MVASRRSFLCAVLTHTVCNHFDGYLYGNRVKIYAAVWLANDAGTNSNAIVVRRINSTRKHAGNSAAGHDDCPNYTLRLFGSGHFIP